VQEAIDETMAEARGSDRDRFLFATGDVDGRELLDHQPIFIGFKVNTTLRRQLESLSSSEKRYLSADDSTFLRICRLGEEVYMGKLLHERLTTDRVDDVRRNIVSIMRRLVPDVRLPNNMEILACSAVEADSPPTGSRSLE
jgi:hypothetical protein